MTVHQVEFEYRVREGGAMSIEIDPALDDAEKEAVAIQEIKEVYDDVEDVEIIELKEVV